MMTVAVKPESLQQLLLVIIANCSINPLIGNAGKLPYLTKRDAVSACFAQI